ncbi:MAG TPA: ImcF-related family protein, partial [Gemmatimonadaceae bacterium]
ARLIRERLGEAAKEFGVALPTYVVFTKVDAVPHFEAYTRNFSNDEAREPLGAAVRPDSGGAGTYADRVTPALEQSFANLFTSLAERRLQTLSREHAVEWKPGSYEFPREFNKLRALAVDFLREVGRPSELSVSPILRGFYFTGVQAVFVTDGAPEYVPAPQQQAQVAGVRSATQVFTAPAGGGVPVAPTPAMSSAPRKVPRWNFLPRLMREVVFGDEAAVRITSAGARVNFWRRLGFATASVLALLFIVAWSWSYNDNDDLQTNAIAATKGIAALAPNPVDLPPLDALQRLDALRRQVDTLGAYSRDGAPLHLRWGLYAGDKLYPEARSAYFRSFSKLMFASTRATMLATLGGLPDAPRPTDDYGDIYNLLKAYIITTSHPEKSTVEFLAPALMTRWLAARPIDSTRAPLARRQFETYARELAYQNPFPDSADAAAVEKARAFLRQFAGSERIYQYMLAEAEKANPPVQFNKMYPGSGQVVPVSYDVRGAFTKGGAQFVVDGLKRVDRFLAGEAWVVGEGGAGVDKAKLVQELQDRYNNDFIAEWRKFLSSAQVARYQNVKDAAAKLAPLSGNQSPLLSLVRVVSQNTNVPIPAVAAAFQSAQLVIPPGDTTKLINEKNGPYMGALSTLQQSLDKAANASGPDAIAAASEASSNASNAHAAARQMASGFTISQASVQAIVQNLLEAPITNADGLINNFGATDINARARTFCQAARTVLAKYPFSPDASQQASIGEVTTLIKPGSGTLWRFYNEALATAVERQGNQFVAAAASKAKVDQSFINFLSRAATFADVLFKDNTADPHLSFGLSPIPTEQFATVTFTMDGDPVRSSANGNMASIMVDWPRVGRDVKLSAGSGGTEPFAVGPFSGPWALFQLFNLADDNWRPVANGGYRVGWDVSARAQRSGVSPGAKITLEITNIGSAMPVLKRGFFSGYNCSGDLAR